MLLITGASGYLGSALVDLAVRRGFAVRAVVRDPTRAVGLLPDGVEIVTGDLADAASLTRAAHGCSAVLHVAGSVGHSLAQTRRVNVEGTRRVVNIYDPSPRGPHSYNALFVAAARGEVAAVVDAPVGWVLAEDAALGHLLALEHGEAGRRYVLCGEVVSFGRILHTFADLVGGTPVATVPPGSSLGPDAGTFARRSEVYGGFPPVRIDDRGARALGFAPRGVDEGLPLTADWMRLRHP